MGKSPWACSYEAPFIQLSFTIITCLGITSFTEFLSKSTGKRHTHIDLCAGWPSRHKIRLFGTLIFPQFLSNLHKILYVTYLAKSFDIIMKITRCHTPLTRAPRMGQGPSKYCRVPPPRGSEEIRSHRDMWRA